MLQNVLLAIAFCTCSLVHGYANTEIDTPVGIGLVDGCVYISDGVEPAQFQEPVQPNLESTLNTPTPQAADTSASSFASFSPASTGLSYAGIDTVYGSESSFRSATDAANLLGSSPSALSLGVQQRNPIVTEPRVRGSQVGSLAASGSYWVPARIDLDTALSKIDSRVVEQVAVVPGPYSALYGPGMRFIDTQLKTSPRFENGYHSSGSTLAEFNTNGEQWLGRQTISGGDNVWGFRAGYGHRTGNDYSDGSGALVPSSYKSRDAHLAVGAQVTSNTSVEFQYLRLDQTDVELPGQAFDIDFLVTDGYEVTLMMDAPSWCETLELEGWYNHTRLAGSAQRPGKSSTFPTFGLIGFVGVTDVNSSSAGYRAEASWGGRTEAEPTLIAGTDLRYVKQELDEITNSLLSGFSDVNSPIPKSHQGNPGLFVELNNSTDSPNQLRMGGRVDWVSSDIDTDINRLGDLPGGFSAADLLGSDQFDQDEFLGLGYLAIDRQLSRSWNAGASVGYAERAPNLTERYAIFPFMFLIQNGLNTVTGDPELDKERRVQVDLRLGYEREYLRSQLTLFHAWSHDHITFENTSTAPLGSDNQQVQLKYVNTRLAVLRGIESRNEVDLTPRLTAFANLSYVEGDDRTRNGDFATRPADGSDPSMKDFSLPRGAFSGVPGGAVEPLPGIVPFETVLGIRLAEPTESPDWGIEISARLVDEQNRVAASLLESTTPGFATGDIRTFWNPNDNLRLTAGVENFANTTYREHLNFRSTNGMQQVRQPGVNFYFSGELVY